MDVNEIQRINKEAFEDMIDKFGEMDGWSVDQAKALVAKAKTYWNQEGNNICWFLKPNIVDF